MRPTSHPTASRSAFTLVEMVIVLVVLAVLAALVVPTFDALVDNSRDRSAELTLEAVHTNATALAVLAGRSTYTQQDLDTAISELPGYVALGVAAQDVWYSGDHDADGAADPGEIYGAISGDGATLALTTQSLSGNQAVAQGTLGGVSTWSVGGDCEATAADVLGASEGECPESAPAVPLSLAYADQGFTLGVAEALSPTIDGGAGGYTFAVTSGSVPDGVTFDSTTGTFSTTGLAGSSDGTVDTGFGDHLAGVSTMSGRDGSVYHMAAQPDGKVLVSYFDVISTGGIARLNTDGTLDTGFSGNGLAALDGAVNSIAVQPDGKVVIGGWFTRFLGTNSIAQHESSPLAMRVARLNTDGTLDPAFGPNFENGLTGPDWTVHSVAVQPDGKVVIGGEFTTVDGVARSRVARLNTDGSLDTGFNPGAGANGTIRNLVLQPDGKVVIAGAFSTIDGATRPGIARLNADGSLDGSFIPPTWSYNNGVYGVAVQDDGKVVVGGGIGLNTDGVSRYGLFRLNTDGSVDSSFGDGPGENGVVMSDVSGVSLQADGKILVVAGSMLVANGNFIPGGYLVRFNSDGSLDSSLASISVGGASSNVLATTLQPDGGVLVGGNFSTFNGASRSDIVRLGGIADPDGFPAELTVTATDSAGGTATTSVTLTAAG